MLFRSHVVFPEFLPPELKRAGPPLLMANDFGKQVLLPQDMAALVRSLLDSGDKDLYAKAVASLERILIPSVLRHTQGNQTAASEMLGMSRNTLRQKMKTLGFAIDKVFSENTAAEEEAG